jgi:hypothetical protein
MSLHGKYLGRTGMLRTTLRHICVIISGSLLAFAASGCGMSSFDRRLVFGELDSQYLVERMQAGETSREEEQAFILENHLAWREVRADRRLVNPTEEGPLALKFQDLQARGTTSATRILPWVWMQLAVTDPGLDLRKVSAGQSPATHAN